MQTQLNEIQIHADELRRQTQFGRLCKQIGEFARCAFAVVRRCELDAQCGRDFCEVVFGPTAESVKSGRLHVPQDKLPVVLDLIRLLMPGCTVTIGHQATDRVRVVISWDEEAKEEEG